VSAPRSEPERERYGVVPPPVDAASFQGFLSAAARAALVGTTDSAGVRRKRPVLIPLSARSFLEGLDQGAYPSPREIENKLTDLLNRPAVISFRRLSTQLGLFVLGFELMIASTLPAERLGLVGRSPELMTGFLFGAAAVGVTFATLLRGGVSMRVAGIAVVDATGRQISLLRALGRSLLTFIPVLGLAVATLFSESSVVSGVIATGSVAALLSGLICVAVTPRRRLQDRIAGTYLVLAG
jgi:uncharacterized RDD family membrane protein YckC